MLFDDRNAKIGFRIKGDLKIRFENEKKQEEIPADVKQLLDARAEARKSKNWAESDHLRDEIAALGWTVKDSRDGQSLEKKV